MLSKRWLLCLRQIWCSLWVDYGPQVPPWTPLSPQQKEKQVRPKDNGKQAPTANRRNTSCILLARRKVDEVNCMRITYWQIRDSVGSMVTSIRAINKKVARYLFIYWSYGGLHVNLLIHNISFLLIDDFSTLQFFLLVLVSLCPLSIGVHDVLWLLRWFLP